MRKLTVWLLSVLMSTALLFGQAGASSITGRVIDASGALIPGATVTITDTTTKISQTTQTNSAGLYLFNEAPSGAVDITVSHEGFNLSLIHI